jgi:hypothetical protein
VFDQEYLRPPNEDDTTKLLNIAERRGFSGMLDSMTVCIGSEKIIRQLDKGCIVAM